MVTAEEGDPTAQTILAYAYAVGEMTGTQNITQAIYWWIRASSAGNNAALCALVMILCDLLSLPNKPFLKDLYPEDEVVQLLEDLGLSPDQLKTKPK